MNANEHEGTGSFGLDFSKAVNPIPGVNEEDANLGAQPTVERDKDGNVVIMLNGQVIGTMMKSKKMSYEAGLKAKFDAKRLAKLNAFKATK